MIGRTIQPNTRSVYVLSGRLQKSLGGSAGKFGLHREAVAASISKVGEPGRTVAKIDVHMLTLGSERQDWMEQAIASVPTSVCNLHVTGGIRGDLGRARVKGYRLGTCEFVSFVDPDDWIEPNTFERCLAYLEAHDCPGVVTQEIVHDSFRGTIYLTANKHGLSVYRRDWIEVLFPQLEDGAIAIDVQISSKEAIVQMPFVGRNWRLHRSHCFEARNGASTFSMRKAT